MISLDQLNQIKNEYEPSLKVRLQQQADIPLGAKDMERHLTHVMVCGGTGCHASKGDEIRKALAKAVADRGLDNIHVSLTGCFGLCETGPNIVIYPEGIFYTHVTLDDVDELVASHFEKGHIVERLLYKEAKGSDVIKPVNSVNFYKKQVRVALKNCGIINPEDIKEYIALDGYQALAKVVTQMTPREAVDLMKDANLRGRGGAGFSAGRKWETALEYDADQKYVICNGDEGDPGAFMDRSILEGDPHSVLEGMAIAGYCIGANKGYIYVRAEYPIAVGRLRIAIEQAKAMGLLGDKIFGSDFSFDIEIRLGAGAFVCGEGTAMIESIEGKRGMPRTKVYRTAHKGLWDKPTIINNVETLANVAQIYLKGVDWFKSIGTADSPGTKVFALGGKVTNTGLVEVPMGMTLREIIYDIGGGALGGRKIKAVQTGGPSGGCIPESLFDTPVDFISLEKIGSIMGSGGMVVMDDGTCMVDIARFFLDFTVDESCGKCVPCREGTKRLHEMLDNFVKGKGKESDLEVMEKLCETVTDASLCGLGKTAANPIITTMKFYRDEYEAHVKDKKCPAGACQALLEYYITEKCIGCGACARACPVGCISGEKKERHVIDTSKCIKCGACFEACPPKVKAVIKR